MYNFCSSFSIHFRFSPDISHNITHDISYATSLNGWGLSGIFWSWGWALQNCGKCSFKGLGPSKNQKFSFSLYWYLILSKNETMCKFLLILHDPNAQKQFLAFLNQAPIMMVVIFWDLLMFYKILFLPQVIWLLVLKTVYVVRCAILYNLKKVKTPMEEC